VESTFIKLGFLIPYYHTEYLIGLKADPWPRFNWTNLYMPAPATTHCTTTRAMMACSTRQLAPRKAGNTCGVASYKASASGAWGWMTCAVQTPTPSLQLLPVLEQQPRGGGGHRCI
jgi:hypothetical protein